MTKRTFKEQAIEDLVYHKFSEYGLLAMYGETAFNGAIYALRSLFGCNEFERMVKEAEKRAKQRNYLQ